MEVYVHTKFQKDYELMEKRGKNLSKLDAAIEKILHEGKPLPNAPPYWDHLLSSQKGVHDAHIEPDWILQYKIQDKTLSLIRTGTHSDLF